MKREFDIMANGKIVGRADVVPCGLYYDVHCKCNLQDGIVRIVAKCVDRRENIGICVPSNGKMVIQTRIPQKRLCSLQGFEAVCQMAEEWIAITEGKPISCLSHIADARFIYRNGCPGLIIPQAEPDKNLQA